MFLVIAFSPIGNAFTERLRQFPSLINCCTIDWFQPWPEEALERVAWHFLEEVELSDHERKEMICNLYSYIGYYFISLSSISYKLKGINPHLQIFPRFVA